MAKSSKSAPSSKVTPGRRLSAGTTAKKPYAGFPLTPHPSQRWCKKIRGKLHYFGKIDSPEAALERFNREWPYLKDGRTPPTIDTGNGCTVHVLCNAFLNNKRGKLDAGELSPRSFQDYFHTCELLIERFGRDRRIHDLRPDDYEGLRKALAQTRAVVALKNEVNRCRMVLKFAFDQELIDKPVRFGQSFDRPSANSLRTARNAAGPRLFNVDELTRILAAASVQMRAMVLLGLNCGFGNTDVATLPQTALNLDAGWVDFPRPKTGIHRRIPLWPETVAALRLAIAQRREPKYSADAAIVFLNRAGARWVRVQQKRDSEDMVTLNALSLAFGKLLKGLGINSYRNFYTLRHNFETWGGEAKEQVAVDAIMGHVDPSMGAQYREGISDERLWAVVNKVREHALPASTAT